MYQFYPVLEIGITIISFVKSNFISFEDSLFDACMDIMSASDESTNSK